MVDRQTRDLLTVTNGSSRFSFFGFLIRPKGCRPLLYSRSITAVANRLKFWRSAELNGRTADTGGEPLLRAEIFSVDQLSQHAANIAASHRLTTRARRDSLIRRLNDNERVLVETHDLLMAAVQRERRITPAAEWLLDNFYLVEEQIRIARRHLPPSYDRQLPCLANGFAPNFPRVYAIALELISHVDGRLDHPSLNAFISAYQSISPLKLGELWALPIVLRLALIENLRRVAARLATARKDRDSAADWADRLSGVVERNPTKLILVLADMTRADPPLTGAFLAELTRHLQGQSAVLRVRDELARSSTFGTGPDRRTPRQSRGPNAGGQPGIHWQQHHEPAIP